LPYIWRYIAPISKKKKKKDYGRHLKDYA
jgi:hypothetical protein